MTTIRLITGSATIALSLAAGGAAWAQAQQVPVPEDPSTAPQLEVAGVGIASLDSGKRRNSLPGGGRTSGNLVNLSDSSLLVGAAERLYRGAIGSFSLGGIALDQTNSGLSGSAQLFLHQAFLDYQALRYEAYVGRTNTPAAQLVQFPTFRDDDLLAFTNLLNPFSDGGNAKEHQYSNIAAVTLNQGQRSFENFHAQNLIDSASGSGAGDRTGLNSYGVSYQNLNLPGLEAVQNVVSFGGGYEYRSVGASAGGGSHALYAGGVVNLKPSTTNRIDLRVLGNATFGNNLKTIATLPDSFRADAYSVAAAVRYLHSPYGTPGSQVALTAGYRAYDRISNAGSFGVALTGVKRLGRGFDLVGQLVYQRRNGGLAPAYNGAHEDRAAQIGFIFNYDATFNPQVGPRRSLLNLQHQYIPN